MNDTLSFLRQAAHVCPSARQLSWYERSFYAFVHFSPNTYTNLEWGLGNEDPAIFNPTDLDCDQWVEAIKSAGMRGLVLTAKHHDGFCLWPTKYTEHCIRNSPYRNGKGDIVREAAEACRRGGIAFGFYLSPWDRNNAAYGTDAYNDYYKAQLTELLTGYGDIFHVWFDGACGEGPNGKRQAYDFEGYIELVRTYQPQATIFHDYGPDVRWIGNERGRARHAEWAVIPREMSPFHLDVQTGPGPLPGDLSHMYNTQDAIGCLSNILYSKGLCFLGAEVDMSIRPGWFYHANEEPHALEKLFDTYCTSVGGNACFHLNIPPMPNGRFDPRDVARLAELGNAIRQAFANNLAADCPCVRSNAVAGDTQCFFTITLPKSSTLQYVVLREQIAQGQRVESFLLEKQQPDGSWKTFFEGTTIGNRKICRVHADAQTLRVHITAARDRVDTLDIALY
ncbi:MAG: alpha-L-fucosidase [Clostridia bacterium]